MPYIYPNRRNDLDARWTASQTVGELNYCITQLLLEYTYEKLSYQTINDCLGALEGAKLEFYRRVAVPYETKKCEENGDVYPYVMPEGQ